MLIGHRFQKKDGRLYRLPSSSGILAVKLVGRQSGKVKMRILFGEQSYEPWNFLILPKKMRVGASASLRQIGPKNFFPMRYSAERSTKRLSKIGINILCSLQ